MEYLFKLKKDGKTVGYLQLRGNVPSPATAAEKPLTAIVGLIWYNAEKTVMALQDIELQWDTAHPFVTKDKNGKDVFADDNVKVKPMYIGEVEGFVGWCPEFASYHVKAIDTIWLFDGIESIELIEDKENG